MVKGEVITYRIGSSIALAGFLQAGDVINDVSHHPAPDDPLHGVVVWGFILHESTLTTVEADNDHFVLWSEEVPEDVE